MSGARDDVNAILDGSDVPPPGRCHTIDRRGYTLCGAFRSRQARSDVSGPHTLKECRANGHKTCVACNELNRQLGRDWRIG